MKPEEELRRLQKDLANAEADRKCFAGETEANITKQHTKIDNLKLENYKLRDYVVGLRFTFNTYGDAQF